MNAALRRLGRGYLLLSARSWRALVVEEWRG